jgi:hypothetical protein
VLVNHCSQTPFKSQCLQSAAPSPKPDVIINACKTVAKTEKSFLFCLREAAPSAQPDLLVSSCSSLAGLTAPEVVSCFSFAARSPVPELVIDACEDAVGFGPGDRIPCIAAAVGVDLVNSPSGAASF